MFNVHGRGRRKLQRSIDIKNMRKTHTPTDNDMNKQLKKELLDVFHKFGYLSDRKDYEVKIRTTSGSIAWININRIETIK